MPAKSKSMNGMTKKKLGIPSDKEKLNTYGINEICMRIVSGESQKSIAVDLGVNVATFCIWVGDDKHSAQIKRAIVLSARHWDERAEDVLTNMAESPMGIARARELASHYRWRAKSYNRRDYGDQKEPSEIEKLMVEKLRRELSIDQGGVAAALAAPADKLPS